MTSGFSKLDNQIDFSFDHLGEKIKEVLSGKDIFVSYFKRVKGCLGFVLKTEHSKIRRADSLCHGDKINFGGFVSKFEKIVKLSRNGRRCISIKDVGNLIEKIRLLNTMYHKFDITKDFINTEFLAMNEFLDQNWPEKSPLHLLNFKVDYGS